METKATVRLDHFSIYKSLSVDLSGIKDSKADRYLKTIYPGTCLYRINDSHFFPCYLIHSIIGQLRGHC